MASSSPERVTTVFVAAPLKQWKLRICGREKKHQGWRQVESDFEPVEEIEKDFWIFKGTVPVPCPAFKFLLTTSGEIDDNCIWEGVNEDDIREPISVPDSKQLYVFKNFKKTKDVSRIENSTYNNFFTNCMFYFYRILSVPCLLGIQNPH